MAYQPHKRPDGKPAKAPNGKPITAHADCCNCGGGGGCCVAWGSDQCSYDANSGITLTLDTQIDISARLVDSFGVRYTVPTQTRNLHVVRSITGGGQGLECSYSEQFPVDYSVVLNQQGGVTENRQVQVAVVYNALPGFVALGAPFPTDFFTQGPTVRNPDATNGILVTARFGDGLDSPTYPDVVDFAGTTFGIQGDADPVNPLKYGGRVQYNADPDGALTPFAGQFEAVGVSHSSAGSVSVSRNACAVTMTARANVSETFGSGAGRYSFRTIHTLTIAYGPCSPPPPGRPGDRSVIFDPAVDAVFREYGRCKGCGDGNPMA